MAINVSLPGWTTKIDEVSNGVFSVSLTDNYGRKAEITDHATDETILKAMSYAFDIEKQVSKNWNRFLFDFCVLHLKGTPVKKKEFNDAAFGSWLVEFGRSRIVYDGKDSWLMAQIKKDGNWQDMEILTKESLDFYSSVRVYNSILYNV